MTTDVSIHPFDPQQASEPEWIALNDLRNAIRAGALPDDSPLTVQQTRQGAQLIPGYIEVHVWAAWEAWPDRMAAWAYAVLLKTDENRHLVQFEVEVRPEQRRQTEASLRHQGIEHWTMYARHSPTGQFAGYTETYWNPNQLETLQKSTRACIPRIAAMGSGSGSRRRRWRSTEN